MYHLTELSLTLRVTTLACYTRHVSHVDRQTFRTCLLGPKLKGRRIPRVEFLFFTNLSTLTRQSKSCVAFGRYGIDIVLHFEHPQKMAPPELFPPLKRKRSASPKTCKMSDVVLLPFPLTWLWGSGKDAPSSASLAVDDKAVPARDKIQSASDTRKFPSGIARPTNTTAQLDSEATHYLTTFPQGFLLT